MPNILNIKTNRKEIEIQRDGQIVGSVYFDPSDISIIKRLREAHEKLAELNVNANKEDDIDTMLAEAEKVDKELRAAVDYAFDYPCSDVVFGAGYSFTSHNGVSALEQFLSGAIDYISEEMNAEARASQERQDKYLAEYKNKK